MLEALILLSFTFYFLPMLLAILLDIKLGDPTILGHPIIFFGRLIGWGEKRFNRGRHRRLKGALYSGLLVGLTLFLAWYLLEQLLNLGSIGQMVALLLATVLCFYMLSGKTLIDEVSAVFREVDRELEAGRRQVARIVGRDTAQLSAQEVRTAALETLAENLSDGVVGPILSWALLGTPGILTYKMINTQDSMVGYLNERYRAYGFFSAKLDDLVNLLPSRLTALFLLLGAGRLDLIPFVLREGKKHLSPNSGYPEAALAGLLGCRFGGAHDYFGELVEKPYIGTQARELTYDDLTLAVRYFKRASWFALLFACLLRGLLLLLYLSSTCSLILPV